MFYLEAGVDFEEGDGVTLHHVFDGAGAVVAGFTADGAGGGVDLFFLFGGEEGGGGFFDEFLEAALQGAVAGADDDDVAVLVGEDLGFDVAGTVEVLFDEAFAAAEGGGGFTGGGVEEFGDFVDAVGDFHAASAAAEGGFDGDWAAVFFGEGDDSERKP